MIDLNNKQKIILVAILIAIILIVGYYIWSITQNSEYEIIEEDTSQEKLENISNSLSTEIIVHIAGAVENEGIQKLPENSRVADAIEAAGGLTSDANTKNINLAQKILDGQKIYIPTITEETSEEIIQNSEETTNIFETGLVNINLATQTELETLPGIGPSTASKIISYRNENGKFNQIEDIQNVSGIGESKYNQIKDRITT